MAEARPVLIAGAGPTGMTAALELARFRVPVRLVERRSGPATTSRAIGVQARTLELFEQRGLAEALVRAGNPARGVVVHGGGKARFEVDFGRIPSRYPFVLIVSQVETERVLRDELARRGVAVEWGVELIALALAEGHDRGEPGGRVGATLRHPDGALEAVDAAYLIAAEGAHSLARSTLGLAFEGHAFQEGYALGDFTVDGDLPDDRMSIFASGSGLMALFPFGHRHFRLVLSNPGGHHAPGAEPTLAELQGIYDERSEVPARFRDLTWSSYFAINSRMVAGLRRGRAFFGGDSAHIHSPAGGQGMNTGIQDMINLGWKLALVHRGRATPDLLDTYGEDRLPVIRHVLQRTEALTDLIGAEQAWFRSIFDHVAPLVVGTGLVQDKAMATVSQVALDYRAGALATTRGHHGHLRAGDRMPDLVAATGPAEPPRRVYELHAPDRFTLLLVGGDDPEAWRVEVEATCVGPRDDLVRTLAVGPPADPDERQTFLAALGDRPALVLIRPDSYVGFLGRGDEGADLADYLRRWLPVAS